MIVNETACMERLGHDRALLRELLEMFAKEKTLGVANIARAIAARDAQTLHRESHKLKGGASCFEAEDTVAVAYELESLGKKLMKGEGDWDAVAAVHARLLVALEALQPELDRLAREKPDK